ncbi:putative endonuclease NucS [Nocardia nova SH22a]|uniref:Putative endonuclease NucS n=2 Tax=Nocardia nova TaxID=37330 RepID=W5TFP4_9NOCA|nr:putative endonuclease NucS [Nocardia nova SH22a]
MARRLLLMKADGSVLVHSDGGSYKPLNWMSPPCWMEEREAEPAALADADTPPESDTAPDPKVASNGDSRPDPTSRLWVVTNKAGEELRITVEDIEHDSSHELGVDPGLVKDGVEAHLQELLAEHIGTLGEGYSLIRREYMTAIGPVDILCRDADGATVAVEIKRRGEIDGVEQLTRYLELLNRDPLLAPVAGVFAAQQIKPQARTLATDRGIRCVTLDYDALRGTDSAEFRLF